MRRVHLEEPGATSAKQKDIYRKTVTLTGMEVHDPTLCATYVVRKAIQPAAVK